MSPLALVALAGAEDLELRASQLSLSEERALAEGEVVLLYGGGRLEAEHLELDLELERMVLGEVRASACGCARPPWVVSAREAELDLDQQRLELRGARFEVLGMPLLWLPRYRMGYGAERAWVGFPEAGSNGVGRWLGVPLNLQTEDVVLQAVPELYWPLDFRLRASARGDFGHLEASLTPQHERGALSGDLALAAGGFGAAWRGGWISDLEQQQLYGDGWMDRSLPWTRQLGVVSTPWGLSGQVFGFQEQGGAVQPVVSLPFAHGERLRVEARSDFWAEHARLEAGARLREVRHLGPLEAELDLGTRAFSTDLNAPSWDAAGRAEAGLPLWSSGPRARWELVPGLELGGGHRLYAGTASGLVSTPLAEDPLVASWMEQRGLFSDQAPEALYAGPRLELTRWGEGRIESAVQAPWTPEGWLLGGHTEWTRGRWSLRGQGSRGTTGWLAAGGVQWRGDRLALRYAAVGTDGVAQQQTGAELSLRLLPGGVTQVGSFVVSDLDGWVHEVGGVVGYAADCGCLDAGLRVAVSDDRELPYGGLWLDLRP